MSYIEKLSSNYYYTTTDLCHIMKKYGSDKGLGWHNYTTLYSLLFEDKRHQAINIFELGLGTNNVHIPSNMGAHGRPGASLRGWQEYFDHADTKVFGADIDRTILFKDHNISTYYVDQLNKDIIKDMWNNINEEFDIILDDGLHTFDANWNFFENSIYKLKKGGFYIVEDLLIQTCTAFEDKMDYIKQTFNPTFVDILKVPHSYNNCDNNVFVLQL